MAKKAVNGEAAKPAFKIERGLAQPPRTKFPFALMEIGDSFFFKAAERVSVDYAYQYGRRTGKQFAIRKDGEGYRCFRVG